MHSNWIWDYDLPEHIISLWHSFLMAGFIHCDCRFSDRDFRLQRIASVRFHGNQRKRQDSGFAFIDGNIRYKKGMEAVREGADIVTDIGKFCKIGV